MKPSLKVGSLKQYCVNFLASILPNTKGSLLIHYKFMEEQDPIAHDFTEFTMYYRTYAVIGLVMAENLDYEQTLEQFNKITSNVNYHVCRRIFVLDCEAKKELPVPFVSISIDSISEALETQFDQMSAEIVNNIIEMIADFGAQPAIPSPCGIEDLSGTASRPSTKVRMRPSSRLQKLTADFLVLTGALSEAVASYAIAIEDAKSSNDLIWHTAALEGFQIALCLQNEVITKKNILYL